VKFLFKAYACEPLDPSGRRYLLPGVEVPGILERNDVPVKKGDSLVLRLADGTTSNVEALGTKFLDLDGKTMSFPCKGGYFYSVEIAATDAPKALALGVDVFLSPPHN